MLILKNWNKFLIGVKSGGLRKHMPTLSITSWAHSWVYRLHIFEAKQADLFCQSYRYDGQI
jgi:hypothetical protein